MNVTRIINPKILRSRNIGKLGDPKYMGYVTDKGIFFASEEARKAFSKAACLRGVQCDAPHEVVTVSRDRCILYIGKGDFDAVNVPKKYYSMPDVEIEHGHPHDTPISLSDYHIFLTNKFKSLVAYTPDGRYSKITRLPKKEYRFFNEYFQKRDLKKKMEIARRNLGYSQSNFFKKTDWMYKVLEKEYDPEVASKLEKKTCQYGRSMNVVWEIFANKLGIKYENNLREKPKFSIFERTLDVILKTKPKYN